MATVEDAVNSQARNIEQATGRSIKAWAALVVASGMEGHGEIVAWLKTLHGFTHGNANLVALAARRRTIARGGHELVEAMYAGPKAPLRALHERVIDVACGFGSDVELAPKQAYVSLRRSRQFGTVGPGPRGRLEIGLNLPGTVTTARLEAATGMCSHRVRLSSADELDGDVLGWLREAYERAS
jgi:Domain of unknown function (DUF4287)/Domain of unknown function (DUF5655)